MNISDINNASSSYTGPFSGTRSAVNARRQGDDPEAKADDADASTAANVGYSAAVAALSAASPGTLAYNDAAVALVAASGAGLVVSPASAAASVADDSAAISAATNVSAAAPGQSGSAQEACPAVPPVRADQDPSARLARLVKLC